MAESSRRKDLGPKARLYAECGVPEYWVVDVAANLVLVHTEIVSGEYTRVAPCRKGEHVTLSAFPDIAIALDDVLR